MDATSFNERSIATICDKLINFSTENGTQCSSVGAKRFSFVQVKFNCFPFDMLLSRETFRPPVLFWFRLAFPTKCIFCVCVCAEEAPATFWSKWYCRNCEWEQWMWKIESTVEIINLVWMQSDRILVVQICDDGVQLRSPNEMALKVNQMVYSSQCKWSDNVRCRRNVTHPHWVNFAHKNTTTSSAHI